MMKYSFYNSLISLTDFTYILYNAVKDKFLIISKTWAELLNKSPEKIKQTNHLFYQQLQENNFIINDSKDEVNEIIDEGLRICHNTTEYRLIINPTLNCNFHCWYCYEKHAPTMKMSSDTVQNIKKFICRVLDNPEIHHFNLSFFGGEPLLYYDSAVRPFIDLVRKLQSSDNRKNIDYSIQFTSNGYLLNKSILTHLTECQDSKSFQITLDGYRPLHDKVRFSGKNGSYDRILSNVSKLLSLKINVILRINYTAENLASVRNILDDIKNIPEKDKQLLHIDFQKVWQDKNIEPDDQLLEDILSAFKMEFPYVSDFYNTCDTFRYPCYGDLSNECVINYNGDVFKCTARDFKPEARAGVLTNKGIIQWKNPDFEELRLKNKFNRDVCKHCRIFPVCGGGCAQNALESSGNVCTRFRNEQDKDQVILSRFYQAIKIYKRSKTA